MLVEYRTTSCARHGVLSEPRSDAEYGGISNFYTHAGWGERDDGVGNVCAREKEGLGYI